MTADRTALGIITRARRTAAVDLGFERATEALRRLAGSGASLDEARAVRDRYARRIGARPGAGGEPLLALLLAPEASAMPIEDLDALLQWPEADALLGLARGAEASAAIARARRP